MSTILIIEDDLVLLETLHYNLDQAGFTVATATDGLQGLELARQAQPDLVLLDVMLPTLDGFSVCRILAQELNLPVIMLTALRDEAHMIAGFELGANDYVVKPFSLGELLARIRSVLRWRDKYIQTASNDILNQGTLRLDRSSRRVWLDGREIQLAHKEFELLACLMRHSGTAISRDQLLEEVWGRGFVGSHRTIDVHIRWLREKIEPDATNPMFIHTVRGVGYRFERCGSRAMSAADPAD